MPGGKIAGTADPEIIEEAARWIMRSRDGMTCAEQAQFREWLAERAEHAAAADAVLSAWQAAPRAAKLAGITAPPATARWQMSRASNPRGWRAVGWQAALAGLAVPLAIGGTWWLASSETREYTTGPRQRVAATLPDGSTVWLAPRSSLVARMDPFGRRLELRAGEVTVQVAHQRRSFSVDVASFRIVDRGTLFDIRWRQGEPVTVALVHGQIDIRSRSSGTLIASPSPGQRVTLGERGPTLAAGNAATAIAWRDGRVVFNDCPLSSALAQFAEQGAPAVIVRDSAAGELRVSGAFAVADINSFLSAVAELHPITWRRTRSGYEVASR